MITKTGIRIVLSIFVTVAPQNGLWKPFAHLAFKLDGGRTRIGRGPITPYWNIVFIGGSREADLFDRRCDYVLTLFAVKQNWQTRLWDGLISTVGVLTIQHGAGTDIRLFDL